MLKKLLILIAMLYAAASFAAVDVNKATAAELDGIKGIGPGISGKIVEERKNGSFKDWNDFITRVRGVGETNASKFSAEGLTVNGQGFKGAPASTATKSASPTKNKADSAPAAAVDTKVKDEEKAAKKQARKEKKEKDAKAAAAPIKAPASTPKK
ncbi:conserved hypothetical protein [Acidovorax delafieldii 2AN]|uniref:Uncharacterized protein n=1 Tax=Acidovorax delafieldii 2AN TaxID=573060 RepID=C5T4E5_ACIDE|nr:helix-hairpin-helix domain-containing protein [Acidovorax delafieldii]EER60664.1 conserved hypothetical protein [Acidovorax delafieldii 2AN]